MDNRTAKRPRSNTPTKGGASSQDSGSPSKKKKNSNKKSKKAKLNRSNIDPSTKQKTKGTAASTTATADGQIMMQMLSTFTKLEQSRFEAFKRAALNADAVQRWVASCLANRHNLQQQPQGARKLDDLVAPGQASDITMVVTTLAKIYAQRLVATARKLSNNNDNPLQPHEIHQAAKLRVQQGLDPGFFLQPNAAINVAMQNSDYEQRRLAAVAAQEEYEKHMSEEQQHEEVFMEVDIIDKPAETSA